MILNLIVLTSLLLLVLNFTLRQEFFKKSSDFGLIYFLLIYLHRMVLISRFVCQVLINLLSDVIYLIHLFLKIIIFMVGYGSISFILFPKTAA